MSEYREHWNLASDPPTAEVYARLADLNDRATGFREPDRVRPGLRLSVAGALRRLAAAIDPSQAPSACPDVS